MGIFGEHALRYWNAGLSVIPLQYKDKIPTIKDWSRFHDHLPSLADQQEWLLTNPNGNIGLVLGSQSNVTVVDVDTDDEEVIKAILSQLPEPLWVRIGQKGMVLGYKFSGVKTFRIKDKNKKTVVEYLSSATQVVLPPSIHPKTQKPYVENCPLLEVYDRLTSVPPDIEEKLRAALAPLVDLADKKEDRITMTGFVGHGGRDIQMNRLAGQLATGILRGELSVKRALNNMLAWGENSVEKSKGDPIDIQKGCGQIIQYLLTDMARKDIILPNGWDDDLSDEEKTKWKLDFSEDQKEWEGPQLLEYARTAFNEHAPGPAQDEAIDFIVRKLAKSKNLSDMDHNRILKELKMGTKLDITIFRNMVKKLQKGPIEGQSHHEIAEAAIEILKEKNYEVRYHNGSIWSWEGTHWTKMEEMFVLKVIGDEFGHLPAAKKSNDHKGILAVMKTIMDKGLAIIPINGVNFKNGVLNEDLVLVPHNKDFGMTYVMNFSYDPKKVDAPLFFALLERAWGHDEDYEAKKRAMQEAISVTLFGRGTSYQRAILLYGAARSGKSVLLSIIKELVPVDARCSVPPEEWDDKFTKTFLHGKLLNIVGEISESKRLPGKQFKELLDGTTMTGQEKYGSPFDFTPIATHWLAGNFLPKSKDSSDGFNRRWLIFHFNKPCPPEEIDTNLATKIVASELEAIIAWALQAYPALRERGSFTEPVSHTYLGREMAEKNCSVRLWMRARLDHSPGHMIDEKKLFNNYSVFCMDQGMRNALAQKEFINTLMEHLAEQNKKRTELDVDGTIFYDIKLKDRK